MDLYTDIFLIFFGAIINQIVALLFKKKRRKKTKNKTTLRSTKSKGGSLDEK